jgi:pimeloyl-ACP methyl ester carboxylesterase
VTGSVDGVTYRPYVQPASRVVDVDGPVHVADYGGPDGAPLMVAVHGLGGSHLNWAAVAPYLTDRYRLVAVDLLGHGRTPAAGRTPDVAGHVAMLAGTLDQLSDRPVVLMGNSLGGLVSALCAAQFPDSVAGLVLLDPALPTRRPGPVHPRVVVNLLLCMTPSVGKRYLAVRRCRTTPEQTVRRVLAVTCVDPTRVHPDVVDAHVELSASKDRALGDAAYLVSARSLSQVMARPGPTIDRLWTLDLPVLHLHGDRDILVPVTAARRMAAGRTGWRLEVARDIGHAPMLEAPQWTALRIGEWLDGDGAAARDSAGESAGRDSTEAAGSTSPVG